VYFLMRILPYLLGKVPWETLPTTWNKGLWMSLSALHSALPICVKQMHPFARDVQFSRFIGWARRTFGHVKLLGPSNPLRAFRWLASSIVETGAQASLAKVSRLDNTTPAFTPLRILTTVAHGISYHKHAYSASDSAEGKYQASKRDSRLSFDRP